MPRFILAIAMLLIAPTVQVASAAELIRHSEMSPLRQAIDANDLNAVTRLLDGGADPNALDERALTPLVWAVIQRRESIALVLLQRGADPNTTRSYWSPLSAAIVTAAPNHRLVCNMEMVQLLLSNGADTNGVLRPMDERALQLALEQGDSTCVNILLDHGADPHAVSANGKSILESAVQGAANTNQPELVSRIFALGGDINGPPARRGGPLIEAVGRRNVSVVRLILKLGADPCLRGPSGGTPWDWAQAIQSKEIVELLSPYHCGTH